MSRDKTTYMFQIGEITDDDEGLDLCMRHRE